jgi:hypothetical protein
MSKRLLVTVTDNQTVNINSLKLMIDTYTKSLNSDNFEKIVILHQKKEFPCDFQRYIDSKHIETHSYNIDISDDKYKIKLLLIDFIKSFGSFYKTICYIDPDHLFIENFNLNNFIINKDTFYVSSEVTNIDSTPILYDGYRIDRYYNTSIIFGYTETWTMLLDRWFEVYIKLSNSIDYRHREEIAFSIASILLSINILPVSNTIQSNFKLFNEVCKIFHYGGEYEYSKKIKSCIATYDTDKIILSLKEIICNSSSNELIWLARNAVSLFNDRIIK